MNASLPDDLNAFVAEQLASGGYNNQFIRTWCGTESTNPPNKSSSCQLFQRVSTWIQTNLISSA
jgi:hypothetical protein